MKLVDSAIRYPVTVIVGVFFLVLFGVISLLRIPIQLTPDVTRPNITVTTIWQGASPQEIEREIVEQQEEYLRSVEGLVKLTSESADSLGTVTLEFSVGTDVESALLRSQPDLGDYIEEMDSALEGWFQETETVFN